ncbi:MAG: putative sulfate/molybdate transporter [Pseudomonadota bacterium]|nr:putative sulfate/molybdate transporter [Pseudomonadota bacterium]
MKAFKFNYMEWAGAFGDLGTLIPFITAYIVLVHFNPVSLFIVLGFMLIWTGVFFRAPIPVQPMKAIGILAASQTDSISQHVVLAAGFISGLLWIVLALSGLIKWLAARINVDVVSGIVLGVGLTFLDKGLAWIGTSLVIGLSLLVLTYLCLVKSRFPVMFGLLLIGFIWMGWATPGYYELSGILHPAFHFPRLTLAFLSWPILWQGFFFLALPQFPLTIGNSCLALANEHNRIFPGRTISVQKIAWSLAGMNLLSPFWGGIPVCHGVGGLAGQVRFGARSGGAPVILGVIFLILGFFFSRVMGQLILDFPKPVLGVILFVAGGELIFPILLALKNKTKGSLALLLLTAIISFWNVGIALVVGLLLDVFLRWV